MWKPKVPKISLKKVQMGCETKFSLKIFWSSKDFQDVPIQHIMLGNIKDCKGTPLFHQLGVD